MKVPAMSDPGGRSYSTAVEGGLPVAVRMQVTGDLGGRFLDFVANRAEWLSLAGWAECPSDGHATIVAAGPEALVGALEMACMLGPIDAVVHTLDVADESQQVKPGFVVRR